jgi:hypothetical protein
VSTLDHTLKLEATTVRRLEVITGTGRRRQFSEDFKLFLIYANTLRFISFFTVQKGYVLKSVLENGRQIGTSSYKVAKAECSFLDCQPQGGQHFVIVRGTAALRPDRCANQISQASLKEFNHLNKDIRALAHPLSRNLG